MSSTSNKVERVCQQCGKSFFVWRCKVLEGKGKFCSFSCRSLYYGLKKRVTVEVACLYCGKIFTLNVGQVKYRQFCSKACAYGYRKGKKHSLAWKQKIAVSNLGKHHVTEECKRKIGEANKKHMQDPEHCARLSSAQKKRWQHAERRVELSTVMRERWQNPEYIARVIKAMGVRPTTPEKSVKHICDKYFPDFKYNGDYSLGVSLGGLVPDFININGKKQVIEVFGDYWHRERGDKPWNYSELGRMMAYNSIGYRCLVVWEHELKQLSEEAIVSKIASFTRGKK